MQDLTEIGSVVMPGFLRSALPYSISRCSNGGRINDFERVLSCDTTKKYK